MRKQEILIVIVMLFTWVFSFKRPIYGIAFFVAYYATGFNYLFLSLRAIRPLFITPLIAFVSLLFIQKKKLVFSPQLKLMIVFFAWMCLSRVANGYGIMTGEEIDPFLKTMIFCLLLTSLVETKEQYLFVVWIMVISYAALAFNVRYYDLLSPGYMRMNKNQFGFALAGVVAFPAYFALQKDGALRRMESLCYFMLIVFGIAGSSARGAYLGLVVIIAFLVITNFSIKRLPLLIIPVILILSRLSADHWERFFSVSLDADQGGTGGQRLALWSAAYRMMSSNPLFGVGSGESGNVFTDYATLDEMYRVGGKIGEQMIKTHNMTLQVGADMGFVGIGILILIVIVCFRDILSTRKLCKKNGLNTLLNYNNALGISIVGLLVTGQFANRGYTFQLYTMICLTYCLKMIATREDPDKQDDVSEGQEAILPQNLEVPIRTVMFAVITYMTLAL